MDRANQNETAKIMQQLGLTMQEVGSLNFFGIALQPQNIKQFRRKGTAKKEKEKSLLKNLEGKATYRHTQ
jgi:hypothetical protein